MHNWQKQKNPWVRRILIYVALALVPVVIFGLLYWVAKHT